jgi:hypothetical protein
LEFVKVALISCTSATKTTSNAKISADAVFLTAIPNINGCFMLKGVFVKVP